MDESVAILKWRRQKQVAGSNERLRRFMNPETGKAEQPL